MLKMLTWSSIHGELSVDLPHPLRVYLARCFVDNHRPGVVHPHNTAGLLLHTLRSFPRLVNVLRREVP